MNMSTNKPINFNEMRARYLTNLDADKTNRKFSEKKTRACNEANIWEEVVETIKSNNTKWEDIKNKTGMTMMGASYKKGKTPNKYLYTLINDHDGDYYNLTEVAKTINKRPNTKGYKTQALQYHFDLMKLLYFHLPATYEELQREHAELKKGLTDTSHKEESVEDIDEIQATEEQFTAPVWAPNDEDVIMVAMCTMNWIYEYDGKTYETPCPFRAPDLVLKIGKADPDEIDMNWQEGDDYTKFPNRIWVGENMRDVFVSIPKHKCCGNGQTYVTEMKASKELADYIRYHICYQCADGEPFLFYQTKAQGGAERKPMTNDNISARLKKFVTSCCENGTDMKEGSRALRHMYVWHLNENKVSAEECLPIAKAMRHSLDTQQEIYAKGKVYPKWSRAVNMIKARVYENV